MTPEYIFFLRELEAECALASSLCELEDELNDKYNNMVKNTIWGFVSEKERQARLAQIQLEKDEEIRVKAERIKRVTEAGYFGFRGRDELKESLVTEKPKPLLLKLYSYFDSD